MLLWIALNLQIDTKFLLSEWKTRRKVRTDILCLCYKILIYKCLPHWNANGFKISLRYDLFEEILK